MQIDQREDKAFEVLDEVEEDGESFCVFVLLHVGGSDVVEPAGAEPDRVRLRNGKRSGRELLRPQNGQRLQIRADQARRRRSLVHPFRGHRGARHRRHGLGAAGPGREPAPPGPHPARGVGGVQPDGGYGTISPLYAYVKK